MHEACVISAPKAHARMPCKERIVRERGRHSLEQQIPGLELRAAVGVFSRILLEGLPDEKEPASSAENETQPGRAVTGP